VGRGLVSGVEIRWTRLATLSEERCDMDRNRTLVPLVVLLTVALGLISGCQQRESTEREATASEQQESAPPATEKWELIATTGVVKMVYVPEVQISNRHLLAQILQELADTKRTTQVMFFGQRQHTPRGFPLTDVQILHWRAQYNLNPNTGLEKFVFIEIVDSAASPPKVKEIEANIKPGYAE
jgi:hypothetical protein